MVAAVVTVAVVVVLVEVVVLVVVSKEKYTSICIVHRRNYL